MEFEIVLSPEAVTDFKRLDGGIRASVRKAISTHLQNEPQKVSKSRIKRLRGLRRPEYRLRIDQVRVYYDVNEDDSRVEILRVIPKLQTYKYLEEEGIPYEDDAIDES